MIKPKPYCHKKRITTALLLAAGMGSRLSLLTQNAPKCLTMVNETSILDRLMARNLVNEPFLLIESDLVFDSSLLKEMLYPDRIILASIKPWLNGSTVTINQSRRVDAFPSDTSGTPPRTKYKTVNIYSFSLSSWYQVVVVLNKYIRAGRVNVKGRGHAIA